MIILGIDPGTAQTGWGVVAAGHEIKDKKSPPKADAPLAQKIKDGQPGNPAIGRLVRHVDHGMIKTEPTEVLPKRLLKLRKELSRIIKEHQPAEVVIEQLFFNTNSKSVMAVGRAIGVVMLTAGEFNLPVYEYTPLEAKLVLTGYGRAEKVEVQSVLCKYLNLEKPPRPVHAADALAIAICHICKTN